MRERSGSGADPTATPALLAWRFVRRGRVHRLPMLLSDRGRGALVGPMDAHATDGGYRTEPRGRLGPLGRAVDRMVVNAPVNVGLRERLDLVVDGLAAAVHEQAGAGHEPVRVLSAPCGLIRDLVMAADRLRAQGFAGTVAWTGVDRDERGDVLPAARRRADRAGLRLDLLREDPSAERGRLAAGPFHVAASIGVAPWLDLPEVGRLAARLAALLAPGATLLVDNWHRHPHPGRALELPTRCHPEDRFRSALEEAGYTGWQARRAPDGLVSVWAGRRA
jgi:hypothetical protein